MAELVDAHDSKSCPFGGVGSIPTFGTCNKSISPEIQGFTFYGVTNRSHFIKEKGQGLTEEMKNAVDLCQRLDV